MTTHLAGDLTTVSTIWLITRKDGKVGAFTEHDKPLTVGGITYQSALSYTRSAIRTTSDFSVDNMDVNGVFDAAEITAADLEAGLWDNAFFQVSLVNWANLSLTPTKLRAGWLGKVTLGQNQYQAELRGLAEALQTSIVEVYQPACRNDLGDAHCGFDLGPVTETGSVASAASRRTFTANAGLIGAGPSTTTYTASTIGFFPSSIVDSANGFVAAGLAQFDNIEISGSAFNDFAVAARKVIAGQIDVAYKTLTRERAGNSVTLTVRVPGYYDEGLITFTSGLNNGLSMEIRAWNPNVLDLKLPMPFTIGVADTFTIIPGCNKLKTTCVKKFNNLLGPDGIHGGFRGEAEVPGQDQALSYATTKS